jgi:hypothetical protein
MVVIKNGSSFNIIEREDIFFEDEGREIYLSWLQEYCCLHKVDILAYSSTSKRTGTLPIDNIPLPT